MASSPAHEGLWLWAKPAALCKQNCRWAWVISCTGDQFTLTALIVSSRRRPRGPSAIYPVGLAWVFSVLKCLSSDGVKGYPSPEGSVWASAHLVGWHCWGCDLERKMEITRARWFTVTWPMWVQSTWYPKAFTGLPSAPRVQGSTSTCCFQWESSGSHLRRLWNQYHDVL